MANDPKLSRNQLIIMKDLMDGLSIRAYGDPYSEEGELEELGYIRYDRGNWKLTPKGYSAFAAFSPLGQNVVDTFWLRYGRSGGNVQFSDSQRMSEEIDPTMINNYKLGRSDFSMNNPNNFSDLIKMSLSDYNRRTIENAAGNALIDREITQRQYDYLMEILDEREMIKRKNPKMNGKVIIISALVLSFLVLVNKIKR